MASLRPLATSSASGTAAAEPAAPVNTAGPAAPASTPADRERIAGILENMGVEPAERERLEGRIGASDPAESEDGDAPLPDSAPDDAAGATRGDPPADDAEDWRGIAMSLLNGGTPRVQPQAAPPAAAPRTAADLAFDVPDEIVNQFGQDPKAALEAYGKRLIEHAAPLVEGTVQARIAAMAEQQVVHQRNISFASSWAEKNHPGLLEDPLMPLVAKQLAENPETLKLTIEQVVPIVSAGVRDMRKRLGVKAPGRAPVGQGADPAGAGAARAGSGARAAAPRPKDTNSEINARIIATSPKRFGTSRGYSTGKRRLEPAAD